jgi:hypothetical protein
MKKIVSSTFLTLALVFSLSTIASAQGMMNTTSNMPMHSGDADHTAREEAEGKIVWEKLQAKELQCADLTEENFATLGEYYMGQKMGNSHEAMNNMITKMVGEEGEEQIHVTIGKRMSTCEPEAPMPLNITDSGMSPMMLSMMNNWSISPMINNVSEATPSENENIIEIDEAKGKILWKEFENKEISCADLDNDKFENLGEYFMGRMTKSSHQAINDMMIQMIGEEGEEQMHTTMGKRMSGCDVNAPMPAIMANNDMRPMMLSMMNNWSGSPEVEKIKKSMPMMGYALGYNPFNWVLMTVFWGFAIFGIISMFRSLAKKK